MVAESGLACLHLFGMGVKSVDRYQVNRCFQSSIDKPGDDFQLISQAVLPGVWVLCTEVLSKGGGLFDDVKIQFGVLHDGPYEAKFIAIGAVGGRFNVVID